MKKKSTHSGVTLTELLVVVAVMALLMAVAIPAIKGIMDSFDSTTSVRQLINAALSSARAIAIREQKYAGVRFQQDALGNTYMITIIHDPNATGLVNGFRVLQGRKPMKLPQDVRVITPYSVLRNTFYSKNYEWKYLLETPLTDTVLADNALYWVNIANVSYNRALLDASTFSVVFSPQGKLVIHPVWIRNKDGKTDTSSNDKIFNVYDAPNDRCLGQFLQDDYAVAPSNFGIGPEMSVQSFLLYSKEEYAKVPHNLRWRNCLSKSAAEYVSPYTGELVIEYRNAQIP